MKLIVYLFENQDIGIRASLAIDSAAIFTKDVSTFLFGCGINCFQAEMGYEYGLYPHNFILEALVTFGLIGAVPMLYLIARIFFLWMFAVRNESYLLIIFSVFFVIISFKSGAMLSSFLTTFLIFYASSIKIKKSRKIDYLVG